MVWEEDRRRGARIAGTVVLLVLLAILAGILYLRFFASDSVKIVTDQAEPVSSAQPAEETKEEPADSALPAAAVQETETPAPEQTQPEEAQPEETQESAEAPAEETQPAEEAPAAEEELTGQSAETAEAPAEKAEEPVEISQSEYSPIHYDERSFNLVTDMVFAFKKQPANMNDIIAADVAALKEHDKRLGEAWGDIMDYWAFANNEMEIQTEKLPDDLPDDDSLCIVLLGYQLKRDGTMNKEMVKRCELALSAAQQYPNAYILLTGGGTASKKPDVTEASVMADWFKEQGIAEERLILEDKSLTTDQNASLSLEILVNDYPQIKHLAIISSDYHLPLSCLLFTAASLMRGAEYGQPPFDVVANLGCSGKGLAEYTEPAGQGQYLWALLHPGS